MYNPDDARKSYAQLFRERGFIGALQSILLIVAWHLFNYSQNGGNLIYPYYAPVFLFSCAYFTWKPKLIRFLRGHLRGKEYRDKID